MQCTEVHAQCVCVCVRVRACMCVCLNSNALTVIQLLTSLPQTYSLSQDSGTTHSITPLGLASGPSPKNEVNPSNDESAGAQPPLAGSVTGRRSSTAPTDGKTSATAVREKKGSRITERRGTWTAGLSTLSTPTSQQAKPLSVGGVSTMPYGTRLPLRKS